MVLRISGREIAPEASSQGLHSVPCHVRTLTAGRRGSIDDRKEMARR